MTKRKKVALSTPIVVGTIMAASYLLKSRKKLKERVVIEKRRNALLQRVIDWKNERIKNAFYDTLTQKDVAWG